MVFLMVMDDGIDDGALDCILDGDGFDTAGSLGLVLGQLSRKCRGLARLRISGCYHLFIYFPPPATFPAWPDQWCILGRPTSWPESGFPSGPCHSMHPDRHCLMLYTLQQSAQSILHNAYCTLHTAHCIHAVHLQCTLHITAHTETICTRHSI